MVLSLSPWSHVCLGLAAGAAEVDCDSGGALNTDEDWGHLADAPPPKKTAQLSKLDVLPVLLKLLAVAKMTARQSVARKMRRRRKTHVPLTPLNL